MDCGFENKIALVPFTNDGHIDSADTNVKISVADPEIMLER